MVTLKIVMALMEKHMSSVRHTVFLRPALLTILLETRNPAQALTELCKSHWRANLPCDPVACGVCASLDPVTGQGTVGICEEMKSVDCDDQGLENYGENSCDAVTLPLPGGSPGCDNIPPGGMFGTFIPDCQYVGGLAFVCQRFLQGTQMGEGESCPAPPECTEDQLENLNMPR